jgi:hypothetical protein
VTSCTTRKRAVDPAVSLPAKSLLKPSVDLAAEWLALVGKAGRRTAAVDLYLGRSFLESKQVACFLSADLFIVSAGLGLVHGADLVPNYDLTVVEGGALERRLEMAGEQTSDWWAQVTRQPQGSGALSALVTRSTGLVMLALPASYLRMVHEDLSLVHGRAAHKLRIFTSAAGTGEIPGQLRECVLPYDDRLESLEGFNGTKAEFPQRAMRHFVEMIGGHHLDLQDAQVRVRSALIGLKKPAIPLRQKKTDAEIAAMLRMQWASHGGRSTSLHRYLRDQALVACEQSRFRSIWQRVRTERLSQGTSARAA